MEFILKLFAISPRIQLCATFAVAFFLNSCSGPKSCSWWKVLLSELDQLQYSFDWLICFLYVLNKWHHLLGWHVICSCFCWMPSPTGLAHHQKSNLPPSNKVCYWISACQQPLHEKSFYYLHLYLQNWSLLLIFLDGLHIVVS